MFSLKKLRDGVYVLRMDNPYDLAMTCLRVSEWHESPNPRFRHQNFTIAEYTAWYAKTQSENGTFSYPEDWAGWNIPLDQIRQTYKCKPADFNHYDAMMLAIYGYISTQESGKAYIIAVPSTTDDDQLDRHELTHAMYDLNPEYHNRCLEILLEADSDLIKEMRKILNEGGYSLASTEDEIQAYITTGEAEYFDSIDKNELMKPHLDDLRTKLKALHKQHYEVFYSNISS